MLDLAIFYPNRYLIKVEDFFTTVTFLNDVTNLSRYPLSIVERDGIEPSQKPCKGLSPALVHGTPYLEDDGVRTHNFWLHARVLPIKLHPLTK